MVADILGFSQTYANPNCKKSRKKETNNFFTKQDIL